VTAKAVDVDPAAGTRRRQCRGVASAHAGNVDEAEQYLRAAADKDVPEAAAALEILRQMTPPAPDRPVAMSTSAHRRPRGGVGGGPFRALNRAAGGGAAVGAGWWGLSRERIGCLVPGN
jgi:hypothetical protein